MPARSTKKNGRLYKRKNGNNNKKRGKAKAIVFLLILVILALSLWFFIFRPGLWDGESRLSLAILTQDQGVTLATFDPVNTTITTIAIPPETRLTASRSLGEWRLKSIWRLGEDEQLGGILLSESITKTFHFPTESYAQTQAEGFVQRNFIKRFRALFGNYETNLRFSDKLKLFLFTFKVKNTGRVTFDLTDSGFLKPTRLVDGSSGYTIQGATPAGVLAVFADQAISRENLNVTIVNATGSRFLVNEVGEIVEILGAKVVSITEEKEDKNDCIIYSAPSVTADKLSAVFSCKIKSPRGDKDLELYLGSSFAERF